MTARPVLTIAICTANRTSDLERCVDSLQHDLREPVRTCEILIVDNTVDGTAAATARRLAERTPVPLHYVVEPRRGVSAARNRAVGEARADVIAFIDDDVLVRRGWLAAICATVEETDCAVIGGRVLPLFDHEPPVWFVGEELVTVSVLDLGGERRPVSPHKFLGCNFALRRHWYDRTGGFREDLGRVGVSQGAGEETDLALRIAAAGGIGVYCPDAVVGHRIRAEEMTRSRQLYRAYWGGRIAQRIGFASGEAPDGGSNARDRRGVVARFLARRASGRNLFGEALHVAWLLGCATERTVYGR